MMHGCDQLGILSLNVIVYTSKACDNNVTNIDG